MKTATTIIRWFVRIIVPILIVLGVLFWTDHAQGLIPVHILIGILLVLSLWTLAFLAVRAGVSPGLAVLAVAWGILLAILGLTQARLLVGNAHWLIQILHLLVGLAGLALAERLAGLILRRGATA